jgi:hypothetical protein
VGVGVGESEGEDKDEGSLRVVIPKFDGIGSGAELIHDF